MEATLLMAVRYREVRVTKLAMAALSEEVAVRVVLTQPTVETVAPQATEQVEALSLQEAEVKVQEVLLLTP